MRPVPSERLKDRIATVVIRTGGVLVIVLVTAIVVRIAAETLPLFAPASAGGPVTVSATAGSAVVLGTGGAVESAWWIDAGGRLHDAAGAAVPVVPGGRTAIAGRVAVDGPVAVLDDAGVLHLGRVATGGAGATWIPLAPPLEVGPVSRVAVAGSGDHAVAATWSDRAGARLDRWRAPGGWSPVPVELPRAVSELDVSSDLQTVATLDPEGRLEVVSLTDGGRQPVDGPHGLRLTRIRFLAGGRTLATVAADGTVAVLLPVPHLEVRNASPDTLRIAGAVIAPGGSETLADTGLSETVALRGDVQLRRAPPVWTSARTLAKVSGEPTVLEVAPRRRELAVGTRTGEVATYHATSGRRLVVSRSAGDAVRALALPLRGTGVAALVGERALWWPVHNPHAAVTLRTLFRPVWYEGYAEPGHVWQTSGGSEVFEPKLGLWPLLFGTLKATLYAMLVSVPLALGAAVYVSQLAPRWLTATVKPTVELMAAVPSVVVGFLAAVWLAPRLERALLAAALGTLSLPLSVLATMAVWRMLPVRHRRRLPSGGELLLLALVAVATVSAAVGLADPVEAALFDGDLPRYLFTEWGVRTDQRNALVVGIALGFAVIPVVFTLAEDACSAVPRSLIRAARALGASRWQTAVRLVVPAAGSGMFAAVMLGLGRAVGETMIVLMAAGNTPLLDLSPLNGMRTMSATLAVEIPEATVDGTLYRVLFLTGTLLFALTFAVNTVAGVLGRRLRSRYGRY